MTHAHDDIMQLAHPKHANSLAVQNGSVGRPFGARMGSFLAGPAHGSRPGRPQMDYTGAADDVIANIGASVVKCTQLE